MLVYNADYEAINSSLSKEPRWVLRINMDGAGAWHYFTSHSDALLPAGLSASDYTHSVLKVTSLVSQELNPDEGRATIGAMAVELLDVDEAITTLFQATLDGGNGLNKKVGELYKGYNGMTDFSTQYELQNTQIVSKSVNWNKSNVNHKVQFADAQHLMKKDIFILAKTNITASVAIDATTINVGNTADFETFEHDAGYDDAPSATVGYIKLKKSNDVYEIARYTGKTGTSFTGVTRGVLGTKPLVLDYLSGEEADRQIEVEEYVYLEGPIMKIAYAVLTGSLYGQAGKTLPSGWHLGMDTAYVATSTFTGIGDDIWDTTDPTLGYQCRFAGIDKQDGKKFFEKELMLLAGCFHTVLADGQIAVRRMANAAANAATVGTLDESNVVSATTLENDLSAIKNLYSVEWNWEDLLDKHTRRNILADGDSILTHEEASIKDYTFRGMYGNRMTVDRIYQRFDSLRSMYAGPPLKMQLTSLGTEDRYEIGDTVRVTLPNMRDFTNGAQHSLDRAFMVFGKRINPRNGQVTYNLFGSSQQAGTMPAPSVDGLSSVLPDSFYSSGLNAANNIETMAADPGDGSKFEVVGGVGILKTNLTCTGVAGNINHVDSIFWYDGDLEIAAGVTITVENCAQFRIQEYFDVKGTIDASENGIAGASGGLNNGTAGTVGVIGITRGGGGVTTENVTHHYSYSAPTARSNATMPNFAVEWDGSNISGIPNEMRGTSGGSGGMYSPSLASDVAGGDGGKSGAGIVIISRGCSINSSTGSINLSGGDGVSAGNYTYPSGDLTIYAGAGGGGAPGGLLFVVDGGANSVTGLSKVTADYGSCPQIGTPFSTSNVIAATGTYSSYFASLSRSMGSAAASVAYVIGQQAPQADIPQTTSNDTAPTLVEVTNTPRSAAGNLSTIEITAVDSGDSNYSYSNAYYRVQGTTEWTKVDVPASPETSVVVASDGTTYEVQTRSVSTAGVESPWGDISTITVSNVINPTAGDTPPDQLQNLRIPDVSGLELFQQGNDTEFTGRDPKFTWRKTALTDILPHGYSPSGGLGLDYGTLDQYFQDWRVRIYDGNTLLREEAVTDNWYIYNHEKNAEDYFRINQTTGSYRTFTIDVVVRVKFSAQVSARAARLTVSNPAPAVPDNISIRPSGTAIYVNITAPADLDGQGMMVWMSTSTGFSRNSSTLVYKGPSSNVAIDSLTGGTKLVPGTTYYLRVAYYDAYVDPAQQDATSLNESSEYTAAYTGVATEDIEQIIQGKNLVGTTLQAGSIVTKGSFLNAAVSGSATSVPLVNADDFAASGSGWISDSTNKADAFSWTGKSGDTLTGCSGVLAHAVGSVVIPQAQTMFVDQSIGELAFYADRGDGVTELLAAIGISTVGADDFIGYFGSSDTDKIGVYGRSKDNIGVLAYSYNEDGIRSTSAFSRGIYANGGDGGIYASSYNSYGAHGYSDVSSGVYGESLYAIGVEGDGATYDFYASGPGTNYGPFTGGHDALVLPSELAVLQEGDIIIDGRTFYNDGLSQTIGTANLSRKPKSSSARGVFSAEIPMDEDNLPAGLAGNPRHKALVKKYRRIAFNALGEGMINVCGENGNFKKGDFVVTSSMPGKGMRQDDDIVHNYTVAAVRVPVRFKTPDEVKQVPCIYLCG